MKRVVGGSIGIGVVSVFLLLNMLDPLSLLRTNPFGLVWYCVFWYGVLGLVVFGGIKSLNRRRVRKSG